MEDQDQFLTSTLQKTASLIEAVEERYRAAAFPIVLQTLIKASEINKPSASTQHHPNQQETSEVRLPPGMPVNTFFNKAKPDSHPGRFVCAAYYLLHTGKAEQFTLADILEIYGKLRIPKPKNPSDVMNQCVRKANIIDGATTVDKQKTWVITPDGESYVEGLLNDNSTGNTSTSR